MAIDPDKPESMPRDCSPFDALDPHTGQLFKVYIRNRSLDLAVKRGPGIVREVGFTVREAVLSPKAVFRGDRDEGEPDWLCYVSRPPRAYDYKTGEARAPWAAEIFLVKFDAYRIYQWSGWVKADANDPNLPENHESGFEERLL